MKLFTHHPLVLLVLTLLALISGVAHAQEDPPNILFIAIDDMKPIGSVFSEEPGDFMQRIYPDEALRKEVAARMTPNMQRLADQGIAFMRAYCASPACNPSRAAIMTGIRPHKTGLTTNAGAVFFREFEYEGERPLENAITLPQHLKANGWYTAMTGKIYHSGSNRAKSDYPLSWNEWTGVSGGAGGKTRSVWSPDSLNWGVEGGANAPYTNLNDYRTADFIARVLENGTATNGSDTFTLPENGPFFLACGIFRPHLPFYATQDLIDLFPVEEMTVTRELLELYTQDGDDLPPTVIRFSGISLNNDGDPVIGGDRFVDILDHGNAREPNDGDLEGWKDMLQHYFASCAIADRSVGRLLNGLANSPYADNTLVVVWSDHGYHLGEKLHETKFTLWDPGSKVNFFIIDPRNPQSAGQKCYRPVGLIDIYPTLAALAGVELPDERITGHDLTPLLENPQAPWNIPAQTTYQSVANNQVRMNRYKYIQYEGGREDAELYDMDADPEEFNNLSGESEYSEQESLMQQIHDIAIEEGTYPDETQASLDTWRSGWWGTALEIDGAGNFDDPDADGRANWLEFAQCTNPFSFDLPPVSLEEGSPMHQLTFPVIPGQTDVTYTVEMTGDFAAWSPEWQMPPGTPDAHMVSTSPSGHVVVQFPVSADEFARVRWTMDL